MTCHRDPTLTDLLNDPITQAVMRADGVDPKELESLFHDVARRRGQSPRFACHRRSGHGS
jgi:hypothetical protein